MARLSKDKWAQARATWEADPRPGFDWLASDVGVTRQAVSDMSKRKGWSKEGGNLAQENQGKNLAQEIKKLAQEKPLAKAKQLASPAKAAGNGAASKQASPGTTKSNATATDWELEESPTRGRPTVYKEEYCQLMLDFFNIDVECIEDVPVGDGKTERRVSINKYPTIERFASRIGVTRQTLHDWATDKNADGTLRRPNFSYSYARAKDLQAALLTEGGMSGAYESRFATFAAKNLIGWKDQVESKSEVTVITASVTELESLYAEKIKEAELGKRLIQERKLSMKAE